MLNQELHGAAHQARTEGSEGGPLTAREFKAERGAAAIDAIRDSKAAYMIAVGGAAYLVAKAITKSTVVAFPELGMEAIHEFEVKDMPVTVAVHGSWTSPV